MHWQQLLHELHNLALNVENRNAASEEILAFKDMVNIGIQCLPMIICCMLNHHLVGWGQNVGYLDQTSLRADFMAVHSFMLEFCRVESRVAKGSCLGSMIPRIEKTIRIWSVSSPSEPTSIRYSQILKSSSPRT